MNSLSPRTLPVREQPLPEPTIQCPHCQGDIKLTESLAAPFIKAREAEFRQKEAALEAQVAERVATERKKAEEDAHRKARLALGSELEANKRELAEANDLLRLRNEKLAEAQRAQADLIRKQREVEEQKREMALTVEKRVSAAVGEMRIKARQEVEGELKPPAPQGRAGLAAAAGRGAGAGARVAARQRLRLRHDHARAEGRVRRRCAASGGDEPDGRGVRHDPVGIEAH